MADGKLEVPGIGVEDYTDWEGARVLSKAVKDFCKECMGDNYNEVKYCSSKICSLKPFRTGKNPFLSKRDISDEQREAAAERLRSFHKNKEPK